MANLHPTLEAEFHKDQFTKEVDLSQYVLPSWNVLLKIPSNLFGTKTIIYSKMSIIKCPLFEVLAVSNNALAEGLNVGDFVIIDPDLPENQITAVIIENVKFLCITYQEVKVIRRKGWEEPVILEKDGTMD